MKVPVLSFEEKTTEHWFTLLSNCSQVLNNFKTNPLNIIFDDLSIL